MTVYNVNLGIGRASSGVEYAQAYRYQLLKGLKIPQKYIFLDMMPNSSVYNLARNIGIDRRSVLWFYDVLRGSRVRKSILTLDSFLYGINELEFSDIDDSNPEKVYFKKSESDYIVAYKDELSTGNVYNRLEFVVDYCLVKKEFISGKYVYCTEYYTPKDGKAFLYKREFLSDDGKVVLEEFVQDLDNSSFLYQGKFYATKESLLGVFLEKLNIKKSDWVLLDRSTGTGKAVFTLKQRIGFKLGVVVHAEHFIRDNANKYGYLWNNYYDYQFRNKDLVDAFISSTELQTKTLKEQLGLGSKAVTIPAGYLKELKGKDNLERDKSKFITVSRLSDEKNLDLLIKAFAKVAKKYPITLDVYGEGVERKKLQELIDSLGMGTSIILKGHHNVENIYKDYSTYLSASYAEGFGLSLMEAIGSGLVIGGFDAHYGNTEFVHGTKGGLLVELPMGDYTDSDVNRLSRVVEELYLHSLDRKAVYKKAKGYLQGNVAKKWKGLLK